jgi:hypothetical protein
VKYALQVEALGGGEGDFLRGGIGVGGGGEGDPGQSFQSLNLPFILGSGGEVGIIGPSPI